MLNLTGVLSRSLCVTCAPLRCHLIRCKSLPCGAAEQTAGPASSASVLTALCRKFSQLFLSVSKRKRLAFGEEPGFIVSFARRCVQPSKRIHGRRPHLNGRDRICRRFRGWNYSRFILRCTSTLRTIGIDLLHLPSLPSLPD